MIFTEGRFFAYLALVFLVHRLLRRDDFRKLWLLVASWGFYAAWNWKFIALLLFITVLDFGVGLALGSAQGRARRAWIAASVVANLGLLAVYKYYDFFVTSAVDAFAACGVSLPMHTAGLVIPLGISFHTFQSLSYTIDVYRGHMQPTRRFVDFALFVAFFPQLVAGPIVRALHFLPQLLSPPPLAAIRWRHCLVLFLCGFAKKACIADQVAPVVDRVFADPGAYGTVDHWLGGLLYAVQIYCDFSGYSDMAMALAGVFGYRLVLNFDFPYLADSITGFWRRWHMSLSTWFRDYLYVPLGGNRGGTARTYANLVTVFFLCGLWHGANWTFVVWGLWHGALLLVERAGVGAALTRVPSLLRSVYVGAAVIVGWIFFRSADLASAGGYVASMFGVGGGAAVGTKTLWPGLWLVAAALLGVHVISYRDLVLPKLRTAPRWAFALIVGAAIALLLPWVAVGYQPFIYFQF